MSPVEFINTRRQIGLLFRASLVRRYHNRSMVGVDTVGRHSFMVIWFCWYICNKDPSLALILAAAQHDVPEGVMGDIPSPVTDHLDRHRIRVLEESVLSKFLLPDFTFKLSELELYILKAADRLEGLLYSTYEVRGLGNRMLHQVMKRYDEFVTHSAEMLPEPFAGRVMDLKRACSSILDQVNIEDEEEIGL